MGANVDLFNSREIAAAIWLAVGLVWMLFYGRTRHVLQQLLRSFFQWEILVIVLVMLSYVGLEVFGLYRVGFWDTSLLKDTVLWTLGVAFVRVLKSSPTMQDEHYFRDMLLRNLGVAVFLEFILNLYVFNLWIELVLPPAALVIGIVSIAADASRKGVPVKKPVDSVRSAFAVLLVGFVLFSIIHDWRGFTSMDNLRSFLLPIFLTIGYVPFLYALALCESYEVLFSVNLRICRRDYPTLVRYAKRKILCLCFLNLRRLTRFMKDEDVAIDLMNLKDRDGVVRLIQEARKRGL